MRRTGNTSFSPAIGMVTAGTSKTALADCASAGRLAAAVPASASAPVARRVLRSTVSIHMLRFGLDFVPLSTAPGPGPASATATREKARELGGLLPRYENQPTI